MLVQAGVAATLEEGVEKARKSVASGRALDTFARMVHSLGGPQDFVNHPQDHMFRAPFITAVTAPVSGYLSACDTRGLGLAVWNWGVGVCARPTRLILAWACRASSRLEPGWKRANRLPMCMPPIRMRQIGSRPVSPRSIRSAMCRCLLVRSS